MSRCVRRLGPANQKGFTLIELSVVTGIIGVLAALAVPAYGSYKSRGVDGSMHASIRNARTSMEAYAVQNGDSSIGATISGREDHGDAPDANVPIQIDAAAMGSYRLRACARGGTAPSFVYDSTTGRVVVDPGTCS